MEGIKIVIFALVALVWLVIWIVRMFSKAFNQPTSNNTQPAPANKRPYNPNPASLEEMIRQHRPKTPEEIQQRSENRPVLQRETLERPVLQSERKREVLERSTPKPARSLENLEPRRRSLETLKPMGRSLERKIGESTAQREESNRRRAKNMYQASDKKPVSIYAKMLGSPESARHAIVLAEILKPKFDSDESRF